MSFIGLSVLLASLSAAPADALVGRWRFEGASKDVGFLELRANGLGRIFMTSGTWSADGTTMTLTPLSGAPLSVTYKLAGDKLTGVFDGSPVELVRMPRAPGFEGPWRVAKPEPLGEGFFRVDHAVFALADAGAGGFLGSAKVWVEVPARDASKLRPVAPGVAVDGQSAYFVDPDGDPNVLIVPSTRPAALRVLVHRDARTFFTDGVDVFAGGARVVRSDGPGAADVSFDPATFQLGPCGLLRDRTGTYRMVASTDRQLWRYRKIDVDPKRLEKGCPEFPKD